MATRGPLERERRGCGGEATYLWQVLPAISLRRPWGTDLTLLTLFGSGGILPASNGFESQPDLSPTLWDPRPPTPAVEVTR